MRCFYCGTSLSTGFGLFCTDMCSREYFGWQKEVRAYRAFIDARRKVN